MKTRSREGVRIDWGLFLAIIVGARGFDGFAPDYSGQQHMIAALLILVTLVFRYLKQAFTLISSHRLILLMTLWMSISSMISARPAESLAAVAVLFLLILYAAGLEHPFDDTMQTFALATSAAMIPSILGLILPVGGVAPLRGAGSSGGYAGYFPWNSFAGYCAGGVLISIAILYFNGRRQWWHLPAAANAVLLLVVADAAAPYMALCAAGAASLAIPVYRRLGAGGSTLVVALSVPLMMLAFNLGEHLSLAEISKFFGRDEKLSGRTDVWRFALEKLAESPLFGFGSGGIWEDEGRHNSAHNGYLETALKWGLPAALILIAIILIAGFRLFANGSPLLGLWAFGAVANMAGSQIAGLSVTSLAIWLAVGSTYTKAARDPEPQVESGLILSEPR